MSEGHANARHAEIERFVTARLTDLNRVARALTHDRSSAEDLVAVALANSIARWSIISGSPYAYVRRAIVHTFLNDRRRSGREVLGAVPPNASSTPGVDVAVVDRVDIVHALERLTAEQRAVVVLRFLEDLPAVEVARVLDRPAGTIRRISHDALSILRHALDPTEADG